MNTCNSLCSGLFLRWKTICDTLLSVQVSFPFGKPYVMLCSLFSPLSTLENHMWRFALCSGLFRPLSTKPYICEFFALGLFLLWKTLCEAFALELLLLWKTICEAIALGLLLLWKTICEAIALGLLLLWKNHMWSFCPLFRTLSTLENRSDALPFVQVSFHFGNLYVTLCS